MVYGYGDYRYECVEHWGYEAKERWNGGNNFSKKRTQRYFEKVMCVLKSND